MGVKLPMGDSFARRIAVLSAGTGGAQAAAAIGQFAMAIWLTPEDYGAWAQATSMLVLVSALTNLGEVNAYLSSGGDHLAESRRAVLKVNVCLAAVGCVVAAGVMAFGDSTVGLLMALVSLNIPLSGDAGLLYAGFVKRRLQGEVVKWQWIAGGTRVAIGIAIAWAFASPVAFGVSMIAYSGLLAAFLSFKGGAGGSRRQPAPRRTQLIWAVQSVSQSLPTQADFIVASLVASPAALGIYFFSYQITVGISSLVSLPLTKSLMAELSAVAPAARAARSQSLAVHIAAAVGIGALLIGAVSYAVTGMVSGRWEQVVPVLMVLAGGLPARFLVPVVDAGLIANKRWGASIRLNVIDAVGTGAAATVGLTNSPLALACATVAWKVFFSLVRYEMASRNQPLRARAGAIVPIVLVPLVLTSAALVGGLACLVLMASTAGAVVLAWKSARTRTVT